MLRHVMLAFLCLSNFIPECCFRDQWFKKYKQCYSEIKHNYQRNWFTQKLNRIRKKFSSQECTRREFWPQSWEAYRWDEQHRSELECFRGQSWRQPCPEDEPDPRRSCWTGPWPSSRGYRTGSKSGRRSLHRESGKIKLYIKNFGFAL